MNLRAKPVFLQGIMPRKPYLKVAISPLYRAVMLAIAFAFASQPACLYAGTIYVPKDSPSIQTAVNAASAGDTIIVKEGTYNENISIGKAVLLKSEAGADLTFIVALKPEEPALWISGANGVELSGFTLTGSRNSGVRVTASDRAIIRGNMAIGNESGIMIEDSRDTLVLSNAANHNEVYGIYLSSSHGSVIEENAINANDDKGLYLVKSNNNRITKNNISLNTWNGITLFEAHNNTVRNNSVLRNTFGIVTSDSTQNDIAENTTLPNFFIILPILLLYLGIIYYMLQRNILRLIYKD
jgi:parallel beta-helix repeat protein